jgi:hypothetical protein
MQQNDHSHFLHKPLQIGPIFIRTFRLKTIPGARNYAMDVLLRTLYIYLHIKLSFAILSLFYERRISEVITVTYFIKNFVDMQINPAEITTAFMLLFLLKGM